MPKRNRLTLLIIIILFIFALVALARPIFGRDKLRLGLDLRGGVHLVYRAQLPEGSTDRDRADTMARAVNVLEERINRFGVTEPIIQREGDDRILVQLPGFTDVDEAKDLVERTGFLEFREVELNPAGAPVTINDYLNSVPSEFINSLEQGNRLFVDNNGNPLLFLAKKEGALVYTDEAGNVLDVDTVKQKVEEAKKQTGSSMGALVSWIAARGDDGTAITGGLLSSATSQIATGATGGRAHVHFVWNNEGAIIFDQIARRLFSRPTDSIQRSIGIVLDNKLISFPHVNAAEFRGEGIIEGNFSRAETDRLANLLTSGALPTRLERLFEDTVSATLGERFVDRSVLAGIIGFLLTVLFMIVYYRLPGVVSALALIIYAVWTLAIFKLVPVTLTLAGIGGFIVSFGMAVDANVLIFERMNEELRAGQTLRAATEAGFKRAWSAIWDSNFTTFIACIVLYWLGSSVVASPAVQGFALTLFIGVAVSMFTAVVVSRTFLRLFVGSGMGRKTSLFRLMGKE